MADLTLELTDNLSIADEEDIFIFSITIDFARIEDDEYVITNVEIG